MQDFSKTRVISSLKTQVKECETCKAIEVVKHKSCTGMCLGDSQREQLLVAEKIRKSLTRPISSIFYSLFDSQHPDLSSRLSSLEANIENLNQISAGLPQVAKKISAIAPNLEITNKVKMLEEKLNRIEDLLNIRAAEIYDLTEQVQGLEIPKDDGVPIGDLTVYKDEIKKQFKGLDDKKWANDQMKLDIIKLKKDKPAWVVKLKREADDDAAVLRGKNKDIAKQLERLEKLQLGISERSRLELNNLDTLHGSISVVQQEQRSLTCVTPQDLIRITTSVFSSYKTMKNIQEKSKSSLHNNLETFKQIPALLPHIQSLQEDLKKNY